MQILINKNDILSKALNEQKISKTTYRFIKYVHKLSVDDGILLYNILTHELLFLDNNEKYLIDSVESSVSDYLIKNWFLVPRDFNDIEFIEQVETITSMIKNIYTAPKIRTFTVLPTTDCNARCFYCFESGCKHIYMKEKTAQDVAQYIIDNKADGKIRIRWFGGEPLCNTKVIDIICNELISNKVDFDSTMVSNSYLFDENLVKHAKENWRLKMVQVTLDGTEDVYNKVKSYIYKDVTSPYKRVLNNIEYLLKAGIIAKIRLNMDMHNYDDLYTLTQQLLERFSEYDNFCIYPHTLYLDSCEEVTQQTEQDIINLEKICNRLYDIIKSNNKHKKSEPLLLKNRRMTHCIADSDDAIVILPNGNLGKCEHFMDDHFIGSIYSKKIDYNMLNNFKKMVLVWEKCNDCDLRPMCYHSNECTNRDRLCYEDKVRRKIEGIEKEMMTIYNNFKEKNHNEA